LLQNTEGGATVSDAPCFAAASPVRAEGLRARTRGLAHPAVLTNSPRHEPRPSPQPAVAAAVARGCLAGSASCAAPREEARDSLYCPLVGGQRLRGWRGSTARGRREHRLLGYILPGPPFAGSTSGVPRLVSARCGGLRSARAVPLGRTWCSTTVWDGPTGLSLGCVLRLMVLPFSLLRRGRRL
jgi:hypothetical protein